MIMIIRPGGPGPPQPSLFKQVYSPWHAFIEHRNLSERSLSQPLAGHLDSCQVRHRTSTYDVVRTPYDIVRQTYDVGFNIVRTISYVRYYIRYFTYDIVCLSRCQHCNVRHRMSDVRYRRFRKNCVVYDVVCQPKPTVTMSRSYV